MVGAAPNFRAFDRAHLEKRLGAHVIARPRLIAAAFLLVPASLLLAQCGWAPSARTLAANARPADGPGASSATFDERFPEPQFKDRFPTASESLPLRELS